MIPKKIHYCWFGNNDLPPLTKACMETWSKKLPDYEIIRWDESNSPMENDYVRYHYKRKNWAFVADYVRFYALWYEGGFYLDTDVEVIKDFEPLRENSVVLGEELPGRLNGAVMGGESSHPYFKNAMDFIMQRHTEGKENLIIPDICKIIYSNMQKNSVAQNIHIFEPEFFYPYHPYDGVNPRNRIFLADNITKNTYAIHHWAFTWKKNIFSRVIRKLKLKLKG